MSPSRTRLGRDAAVRKRRVLAEPDERRSAGPAERVECRADVAAELDLRHAVAQCGQRGTKRFDGDVVGALHERDFGRRLDHPAAGRHRRGQDDLRCRRRLRDAVGDEEADALLDADLRRRHAAVLQNAEDRRAPVFIFLPDPDVLGEGRELPRPRLLETGADVGQLALLRNHEEERPLAEPPPDVGEVGHARARFEHDGADVVLGHQPPRFLDARQTFLLRDGRRLAWEGFERADAVGHRARRRHPARRVARRRGWRKRRWPPGLRSERNGVW